jgi:hypothetical protein
MAFRGIAELGESQAARRGKRIEIRGLNLGTIAADVRESEVVDHDDDDVCSVLDGRGR